ncbi:sperm-associated antigen 8 isoform X2 [Talpa occidentalis]|uniref:sperm-associated antigen 8 isoform X2 n=1 Tax=Talpa occidentalis TaxID=50954 RepID=UPI0023F8E132|nr:sperm-associated antigen 8 isoform X2 [Talpa occidentalis]
MTVLGRPSLHNPQQRPPALKQHHYLQTPQGPTQPSLLMETYSDSLLGEPHTAKTSQESLSCDPVRLSSITEDACTSIGPRSYPAAAQGSSSGLDHDSSPCYSSGRGAGPAPKSGHSPVCVNVSEVRLCAPSSFRTPGADLALNYASCHGEPQKQPPWECLQVPEPGVRGLWKPPEAEEKCEFLHETMPRGQCLLYNWEEERATNHLDQVPSMQDGSESYFFRHGHQGLLTLQLQSPMSCSTTQKDSYQFLRNHHQPLRGKREAMLEMVLHHQICKEVQVEQETTRKHSEVESVTHHDYKKELVQAGPPAPTKPHDYRQEQPETFWKQRASQLPHLASTQ